MNISTIAPLSRPLYVMLKPVGATCNLDCTYCYYLSKKELYQDKHKHYMSEDVLEEFIIQYLDAQTTPSVLFTWHGGEPLLRNISFYKKAIELQKKYAKGRQIENTLQTNGTLLTDEWCSFFKENKFLIGISVDGPKRFHDKYRLTKTGQPTFDKVLQGIALLQKHGVEYNVMGVVNNYNVDYPLQFYHFFKMIKSHYIQFAPIVETYPDGTVTEWSVDPEKWGKFLTTIFDEWVRNDVGTYFIQQFDSALANWMGVAPGVCIFSNDCSHATVMEFNGDVYSCDHFVYPQYKLGNIKDKTITEMVYSKTQFRFGATKTEKLAQECKDCRYLFACNGECPKNRIAVTANGENINYLCKGYYSFFKYIEPYMEYMKKQLELHQAPSNIMEAIQRDEIFLDQA